MKPLADLLVALAESLPSGAGAPADGVVVAVTSVDLALPVEARIEQNGEIVASLPRGRLATGFQMPHGRLTASFETAPRRVA